MSYPHNCIVRSIINLSTNDEPAWDGGPSCREYAQGWVRVDEAGKARGSYIPKIDTLAKTVAFLMSRKWEDKTHELRHEFVKPNHRYFHAYIGEPGIQNTMLVKDLNRSQIQVRDGAHGQELAYKAADDDLNFVDVYEVWMIVENDEMVTWFPGDMAVPSPQEYPENRSEWDDDWAVKLV